MPGRQEIGNSIRKAGKQDEQVSGRELEISKEKALEGEMRGKGTKGPGSGEMEDWNPSPHPATG